LSFETRPAQSEIHRAAGRPVCPWRTGQRGTAHAVYQWPDRGNPDGSLPPDFESQARNCWRNIEAVLHEAGMSFDNLVKTTSFLTDHNQLMPNRQIRNEILGDRKCASSGIVTQTLVRDWLLEIEAIAMA